MLVGKRIPVVEFLINKGAKMDYQNSWSETVFTLVSKNFNKNMLNFLIENFTKQCLAKNFEPSPLEEACFNQNYLKQDIDVKSIISKCFQK